MEKQEIWNEICKLQDLVILDYSKGVVEWFKIGPNYTTTDQVEEKIVDLGFNLNEINYMFGKNIESRETKIPIL